MIKAAAWPFFLLDDYVTRISKDAALHVPIFGACIVFVLGWLGYGLTAATTFIFLLWLQNYSVKPNKFASEPNHYPGKRSFQLVVNSTLHSEQEQQHISPAESIILSQMEGMK